jgi:hypothetical protein
MAKVPDHLAGGFESEDTGGLLTGLLAEEDAFDRRSLWRLGSWGAASVGAVIIAVLANQSSIGWRREQVAAADLARQSQQIQSVAKESQNETRRLASAIDTLNSDRDRLYSRVTVLEQGLDSVTGAIARQKSAAAATPAVALSASQTAAPAAPQAPPAKSQPAPQTVTPAPTAAPVATTAPAPGEKPQAEAKLREQDPATKPPEQAPATVASTAQPASNTPAAAAPTAPLVGSKSMMGPPDPAAGKLVEAEKVAATSTPAPRPEAVALVASTEPDASEAAIPKVSVAVQRTEFGVDVGGANSVGGLRALWRGLLKSRANAALTTLHPIMMIKEGRNGLGMQLRLVAGPLDDAAAAAKICAGLIEGERTCETTVFDGQRLAMKADEPAAVASPAMAKPTVTKPVARRRSFAKRVVYDEPPKKPDPPPTPSTLSTLFGRR